MGQVQVLERVIEMRKEGLLPDEALQALIDEYDPVVLVDHSAALVYPDWGKGVLYLQLEKSGPDRFDVTKLERWLHPKQAGGVVKGNDIHDKLLKEKLLDGCLGLVELLAIQKRGIVFFRKNFPGQIPFGWRSVVRYRDDGLRVPYLIENDGKVVVDWFWLGHNWFSVSPALRFAS